MELGISSLGHIIEYGLNKQYNSLTDLFIKATEDSLNFAEETDINIVELVIDPPVVFNGDERKKFINLVKSYSLTTQIHGPFINVNLCTHNHIIANASVNCYIKTASLCQEINSKIFTIHPGLGNFLINSILDYNKIQLANSVNKLLKSNHTSGLNICLENMPQNCNIMLDENDIEDIFKKINNKDLYFTYDTSHFYTVDGNVSILWDKMHKKIKNIHLVDNFSRDSDTHPPLGTGKVDFAEIFDVIKSYNYQGPLIIELSSIKELSQSITFINKFL